MKKDKENKKGNPLQEAHSIQTPPPPQVIDPSKPPKGNAGDKQKDQRTPKNESDDQQKLTPREEL